MSATRLLLYNKALRFCGEARLASLTEAREPRYLLDDVWDEGAVDACLSRGQWKFAMNTVRLDYDPTVTQEFGYQYAFSKPSDWVVTSALCSDERFNTPLLEYDSDSAYWYCDLQAIYLRYVSNGSAFGGDLSLWPAAFTDYAAAYFSSQIVLKLTSDKNRQKMVLGLMQENLRIAKNVDAMGEPTKFPPAGSWVQARRRNTNFNDGGNQNSLIG